MKHIHVFMIIGFLSQSFSACWGSSPIKEELSVSPPAPQRVHSLAPLPVLPEETWQQMLKLRDQSSIFRVCEKNYRYSSLSKIPNEFRELTDISKPSGP